MVQHIACMYSYHKLKDVYVSLEACLVWHAYFENTCLFLQEQELEF